MSPAMTVGLINLYADRWRRNRRRGDHRGPPSDRQRVRTADTSRRAAVLSQPPRQERTRGTRGDRPTDVDRKPADVLPISTAISAGSNE